MRDKKLSKEEEKMRVEIDNPDVPSGYSGETIFIYKLYVSLLEQVVRLDVEIEQLKGGK